MTAILPAPGLRLFLSGLLMLVFLAACGLKGDLVLPETPEQESSRQAGDQIDEDKDEDEDDNDDRRG
ncbi:MAG: lipoprotein [Wenzhouxiangellaceae bacterium]|nr:lipoprotein [Wenzhouxiangellaceae bacterium]